MGLKLADPSATKRFVRGDDEDWIECRTSLSKRDDMTINDASTSERILGEDGRISLKPAKQAGVDPPVFRLIVADWSLGDVAVEQYEKLDAGDAEWVDSCIRRAIDIARGTIQGNSNSPRTAAPQNDSPNSSDSEASPTPAT
jgi:hypothetical protein